MKNKLNFKEFEYLDISAEELVDFIDQLKPISLKHNKRLVNRVHKRYPFLKKYQIAIIVQTVFYVMRSLLIQNKILYLGTFIASMYIRMAKRNTKHQGDYPVLKVNASTPIKIKKDNNV